MPTWGEILVELNATAPANAGRPDFDGVRRKYLRQLHNVTHRDIIVYYADWMRGPRPNTSIDLGDMQGMMEVFHGLTGPNLDLVIHSPGGSGEAARSIVQYLRTKFDDIRVFVPLAAMSAATMIALAGDKIVMGKHSQLGPIDPQLVWPKTQLLAPMGSIKDQFERAKAEIKKDPDAIGAWIPILESYAPALLIECERAEKLSKGLVQEWLAAYMFKQLSATNPVAAQKMAQNAAEFFASYKQHSSHGVGIYRDEARKHGIVIDDLETDAALQDAVLSVHHAELLSLGGTVKIIENHLGKTFAIQIAAMQVQFAPQPPPPAQPPPATP